MADEKMTGLTCIAEILKRMHGAHIAKTIAMMKEIEILRRRDLEQQKANKEPEVAKPSPNFSAPAFMKTGWIHTDE